MLTPSYGLVKSKYIDWFVQRDSSNGRFTALRSRLKIAMESLRRRISLQRRKPNPLLEQWVGELYEEAMASESRLETMLLTAYNSLKKYPLPLRSAADCAILHGFHKNLCKFLERRYGIFESIVQDELRSVEPVRSQNMITDGAVSTSNTNSQLNQRQPVRSIADRPISQRHLHFYLHNLLPKPYVLNTLGRPISLGGESKRKAKLTANRPAQGPLYKPPYRSGGYAILMALLKHSQDGVTRALPKTILIETAQQYCDESFTEPKPGSHVTAWSSMIRLIKKGLVQNIMQRTMEFGLTEDGKYMALQLLAEETEREDDYVCEPEVEESTKITMHPSTYDIVLLIDNNESGRSSNRYGPLVGMIQKYQHVKYHFRSLKVGDYAWVAHNRITRKELVLPYVVERKRMDDLAGSIKDGRFHEQKFRLHKCGITNVFYLVENYRRNKNLGLPLPSLKQALANTRVQDGFKILVSESLEHTTRLLALLTSRLVSEFQGKQLEGIDDAAPGQGELMSFKYFNVISAKNKSLTVKDLFIKQLVQLKGLSVEKALAIIEKYPTPMLLLNKYKELGPEEGQTLLANLKYGDLSRNVGPCVSKAIYQLFTNHRE